MQTSLIVFSKDRPMQLQALLDSIEIHAKGFFDNIDIVYFATDSKYEEGYELLMSRNIGPNYVKQTEFEDNIKSLFKMDYTCFAADDDIFYGDIDKEIFKVIDMEDKDMACFSLRLGLNLDYCYSNDKPNKLAPGYLTDGKFLKWKWAEQELDFAYPLSAISHIFKTNFIKDLTEKISFKNPNTYEAKLQSMLNITPPCMSSYKEGKVFGVPANSVNDSWTNRNGLSYGYTTEDLNDKYLNGEIIDIKSMVYNIHSAQQEIKYCFKKHGNT